MLLQSGTTLTTTTTTKTIATTTAATTTREEKIAQSSFSFCNWVKRSKKINLGASYLCLGDFSVSDSRE